MGFFFAFSLYLALSPCFDSPGELDGAALTSSSVFPDPEVGDSAGSEFFVVSLNARANFRLTLLQGVNYLLTGLFVPLFPAYRARGGFPFSLFGRRFRRTRHVFFFARRGTKFRLLPSFFVLSQAVR